MSKFQEKMKALEDQRCDVCRGEGRWEKGFVPGIPKESGDCPNCNGTGIRVSLFEKWWRDNGVRIMAMDCDFEEIAEEIFNAGVNLK